MKILLVPDPTSPPPPHAVEANSVAITFINHASFLIRLPDAVVLTDPIFSERCSPVSWAGPRRVRPPGIALADLPRPDVVLLSHNHYDHMNFPTLRAVQARYAPRFITTIRLASSVRSGHVPSTRRPASSIAVRKVSQPVEESPPLPLSLCLKA